MAPGQEVWGGKACPVEGEQTVESTRRQLAGISRNLPTSSEPGQHGCRARSSGLKIGQGHPWTEAKGRAEGELRPLVELLAKWDPGTPTLPTTGECSAAHASARAALRAPTLEGDQAGLWGPQEAVTLLWLWHRLALLRAIIEHTCVGSRGCKLVCKAPYKVSALGGLGPARLSHLP